MLVLTRKVGQVIHIGPTGDGDRVEIHILSIEHHRVKVGIEAPRDVLITRPDAKSHPRE